MNGHKIERFHVSATGHSLNYLPEYIAQRHGFFAEQGLEVTVSVPSPWDRVLNELADGTAAAALGGVWVPSMYYGRVKNYTAFAQVANRAPLALVGRRREGEGFKLADTIGRTVLMKGSNGASVGLFFKMLLRENGIDPKAVEFIQDLDGAMLGSLFAGGMGDFLLVDNLSARALVARHPERLAIAMETVSTGEEIPWSVYYRETDTITPAVLDVQERFCIALGKGMDWVLAHDAETFRDELAEIFPRFPVDTVVDLCNTFRRDGMWTTPVVSKKGYERWQRGIADGHLTRKPLSYEELIDNGPASAAQAQKTSGSS
ncbi:putative abc-type nitrate sulfonate bicarbonate transport periplasmic component protein [Phaeoacremonium minimum UCRPA7]|uniref:4-amino-5-hydroxymethyl-2-methylpyrimidine phosphate synthase n=1 Tax=Phaeoacremonium minimum (strain UCR-PA7) TaxID=1286976 RepID=R8BEJ4_PHAM7|nr:putative abc-type nitrate sulfonate bicarbonate transport periplasmic component protein [Phaeoacremonium minimum UCRPA7]EON97721.1 putative abc-type nitrate sulfonate bicarbonate transport periplasmic component protein [Phaeoacremonium minimum UCRPA7]